MGNSTRNSLARAVFRFSLRTVAPRSSDYVTLRCASLHAMLMRSTPNLVKESSDE